MTYLTQFLDTHPYLAAAVFAWSIVWKGLALWKAASLQQKYWFIIILILNTFGLLEIAYLFTVARKYKVEVEVVDQK